MKTAGEYIKERWLPENMDKVNLANMDGTWFSFEKDGYNHACCMIEIYKVELSDDPEMCFYVPLKG